MPAKRKRDTDVPEPVICAGGVTYERHAIEPHLLHRSDISPITNLPFAQMIEVTPNRILKHFVETWSKEYWDVVLTVWIQSAGAFEPLYQKSKADLLAMTALQLRGCSLTGKQSTLWTAIVEAFKKFIFCLGRSHS
jgi:hypothetical protein